MTVINPYARKKPTAGGNAGTPAVASAGASKPPPVMVTQDRKKKKGPAAASADAPSSNKKKENVVYPSSASTSACFLTKTKPVSAPAVSNTNSASNPSVATTISGGAPPRPSSSLPSAPPVATAAPRLSLKQELAALKHQQKLQKERLLFHKQQKKERKLLKRLEKKQQQQQQQAAKAAAVAGAAIITQQASTSAPPASENDAKPSNVEPSGSAPTGTQQQTQPGVQLVPQEVPRHCAPPAERSEKPMMKSEPTVSQLQQQQHPSAANQPVPQPNFQTHTAAPTASSAALVSSTAARASSYSTPSNNLMRMNNPPLYTEEQWLWMHQQAQIVTMLQQQANPYFPGGPGGRMVEHEPTYQPPYQLHYPWIAGAYPQQPPLSAGSWNYAAAAAATTPQQTKVAPSPMFSNHMPLKQAPQPTATATTESKSTRLALHPLQTPSPFAQTHEVLSTPLFLAKRPNEGFGVTLKLDMQSVLVDVDASAAAAAAAATGVVTAASHPSQPQQQRRRRRKRVFYSVVSVLDPTIQNERLQTVLGRKREEDLLHQDDIILTVEETPTAGLTFSEACALFQNTQSMSSGVVFINCKVTIARAKKQPKVVAPGPTLPPPPLPSIVTNQAIAVPSVPLRMGPLTLPEQLALTTSVVQALYDPRRPLGCPVSSDWLLETLTASHPSLLAARGGLTGEFWAAWIRIRGQAGSLMLQKAQAYWNTQWGTLPAASTNPPLSHSRLTDARRSLLRQAPRRINQCRCGSSDHTYVNDAKCPLYSNLRALEDEGDDNHPNNGTEADDAATVQQAAAKRKKMLTQNLPRTLKVVEKAFTDRIVRIKTEQEAEEAEAAFVSRMEVIQLDKCNQAIFAPSLTAMVLSAVVELQPEYDEGKKELGAMVNATTTTAVDVVDDCSKNQNTAAVQQSGAAAANGEPGDESDDDDEDDDVPLASLGTKRTSAGDGADGESADPPAANKKQRGNNTMVRPQYLARLIQFVSAKWGHVFREPSDDEYTWYVCVCVCVCGQSMDRLFVSLSGQPLCLYSNNITSATPLLCLQALGSVPRPVYRGCQVGQQSQPAHCRIAYPGELSLSFRRQVDCRSGRTRQLSWEVGSRETSGVCDFADWYL